MHQSQRQHGLMLLNVLQLLLIQKQQPSCRIYFIQQEKQPIKLKFHYLQQLLPIHQNNLLVFLMLKQQIIKYLEHYPIIMVLTMPSHLLYIITINYFLPALYKASIFYGLVASSATVYTN